MRDGNPWAEIDASPLLQLPPEQRARLQAEGDARYRAFWADCFRAALGPGRKREDELDSEAFCTAFLAAFGRWEPKPPL